MLAPHESLLGLGLAITQSTHNTLHEAVRAYADAGCSPVPIPPGIKYPTLTGWPNLRPPTSDDQADWDTYLALWDTGYGVGLALGEPSGHLVDIDLDSPEAIAIARVAFPHAIVSGRPSSPASHRWVRSVGAKTRTWKDPCAPDTVRAMMLEVRAVGAQTLVPPSIWNGKEDDPTPPEPYRWEGEADLTDAPNMPWPELLEEASMLAAASLLARYWPGSGNRHEAGMALAGALIGGLGWSEAKAGGLIYAVAKIGGDTDVEDRLKALASTVRAVQAGSSVKGWPALASVYGAQAEAVWAAHGWLTEDLPEADEDGELDEWDEVSGRRAPRSLSDIMADGVPDVPMLVPGWLVEGAAHLIVAPPGAGKSLVCLWWAGMAAEAGHKVLIIDEENGALTVARRAQAMLTTQQSDNIALWDFPSLNLYDAQDWDDLLVAAESADLILFDSLADFLNSSGVDEDVNSEVTRFMLRTVDKLRRLGKTVVVMDHTPHGGGRARGASSKRSQVEVEWVLSEGDRSTATSSGYITARTNKDRMGALPAGKLRIDIDVTPTDPPKTVLSCREDTGPEMPDTPAEAGGTIEQRIITMLHTTGPLSRTALANQLGASRSAVMARVKTMLADGVLYEDETGAKVQING